MNVLSVARSVAAVTRLGPVELLDLALLGAARPGAIEVDRLVEAARHAGGAGWQPAGIVMIDRVEALLAARLLDAVVAPRGTLPCAVRATDAGRRHLRSLLCADAGDPCEPLFRVAMLLKVAFLDSLEPPTQWRVIDGLAAALDAARTRFESDAAACPLRGPGLVLAGAHETRRLAGEAAWLRALRTATGERTAV